jgi:hypothetical protein
MFGGEKGEEGEKSSSGNLAGTQRPPPEPGIIKKETHYKKWAVAMELC